MTGWKVFWRVCDLIRYHSLMTFARGSVWGEGIRTRLLAALVVAASFPIPGKELPAADCNGNGIEDSAETAPGKPAFAVDAR